MRVRIAYKAAKSLGTSVKLKTYPNGLTCSLQAFVLHKRISDIVSKLAEQNRECNRKASQNRK